MSAVTPHVKFQPYSKPDFETAKSLLNQKPTATNSFLRAAQKISLVAQAFFSFLKDAVVYGLASAANAFIHGANKLNNFFAKKEIALQTPAPEAKSEEQSEGTPAATVAEEKLDSVVIEEVVKEEAVEQKGPILMIEAAPSTVVIEEITSEADAKQLPAALSSTIVEEEEVSDTTSTSADEEVEEVSDTDEVYFDDESDVEDDTARITDEQDAQLFGDSISVEPKEMPITFSETESDSETSEIESDSEISETDEELGMPISIREKNDRSCLTRLFTASNVGCCLSAAVGAGLVLKGITWMVPVPRMPW